MSNSCTLPVTAARRASARGQRPLSLFDRLLLLALGCVLILTGLGLLIADAVPARPVRRVAVEDTREQCRKRALLTRVLLESEGP